MTVESVVVGSGAVALAHALFASRTGPVILCGRRVAVKPAVERVPAPLLTLLLELGVVPAELDVDRLTDARLVAWERADPVDRFGPACAHLDRAALVSALWRRVEDCPDVRVAPPARRPLPLREEGWTAARVVDATGRTAVSAAGHVRPSPRWVATCRTVVRGELDPTMMLAAGPTGYGYRLGSAHWLTVAWVGPGLPPRDADDLLRRLVEEGAGWLAEGARAEGGQACWSRRVASVDVPVPSGPGGVVAIGDAALGRDALASQGTSIGLSDARLAAGSSGPEDLERRRRDGLRRHLSSLGQALDTCRHRELPTWSAYRGWLANQQWNGTLDGRVVASPSRRTAHEG